MSTTDNPAQTRAEKLIARAAGRARVTPGETVVCKVDLAMSHDSSGPRRVAPMLDELQVPIWDPSRYVVVTDHYVPAETPETEAILRFTRDWSRQAGIGRLHDQEGICHVVLPQKGHLKPGMYVVGGDSHSPTGGAFGVYMFGVGATEMAGVLATGSIWLKVPQTILMEWSGRFQPAVAAKDVMLFLCGRFGMDGGRYQAVEYAGESWSGDAGAAVAEHHRFDATRLTPQVAAPHSPANTAPVAEVAGQPLDIAYIGACTGAKLDDLRMAARVLAGQRIARGMRLMVAPASLEDQEAARADGSLETLLKAGGELVPTACGTCAG